MKRDLSFGSLMMTITAGLIGILVSVSPMFWGLAESMSSSGTITHPEKLLSAIGGAMLVIFGLVAIILSIIGIFKKGKKLAIATMVFQGLLFVGAVLALVGGLNLVKGADPEELLITGLQLFAPFIALVLAFAGAFVLNLFNVLNMKKQDKVEPAVEA